MHACFCTHALFFLCEIISVVLKSSSWLLLRIGVNPLLIFRDCVDLLITVTCRVCFFIFYAYDIVTCDYSV